MQPRFTRITRPLLALLLGLVLTVTATRALAQSQTNAPPVALTSPKTFAYSGSAQTFTVPAGVTSLTVLANGAQGNSAGPNSNGKIGVGGNGGRVTATLTVTPGQTLTIIVGGTLNSFNGGGAGASGNGNLGAGGGGATDIRIGSTGGLVDRVLVAGGGGGGCATSQAGYTGGVGGNTTGATGSGGSFGGGGGTTTGGTGGAHPFGNPNGAAGVAGTGGAAGTPGGGGGGGYYGGGGGTAGGSGGGGSSYTSPTLATNVIHTQGAQTGDGTLTLSWTAGALPVTLAYFNGRMTTAGAVLGWATAREDNNAGFRIERGTDAQSFESIATVPSQSPDGNSVTTLTYAFTDAQPLPGTSYYRLRQTDRDGTVSLSRIIALSRESVASVLFPNPLGDSGIALIEPSLTYEQYVLSDEQGRVVAQTATPGVLSRLSLVTLPAGVYLLRISTATGPKMFRFMR